MALIRRDNRSRMRLRDCHVRSAPIAADAFPMLDAGTVALIALFDNCPDGV
jgi:hypothetical protein